MKCSYHLYRKRECRGQPPSAGVRGYPERLFFSLRRRRRRKKRKKWGTAPYPSQGAKPLATPYKRCLTGFSTIRDVSYITSESEPPKVVSSQNCQSSIRQTNV